MVRSAAESAVDDANATGTAAAGGGSHMRGLRSLFGRLKSLGGGNGGGRGGSPKDDLHVAVGESLVSAAATTAPPSSAGATSMDALPDAVLVKVFAQLPWLSLFAASCVSKRWRAVAGQDALWHAHMPPEWEAQGPPPPLPGPAVGKSARDHVLASAEWRHLRWTHMRLERVLRGNLGRRLTNPLALFGGHGGGSGGSGADSARRRSSSSSTSSHSLASLCTNADRERAVMQLADTVRVVRFWSRASSDEPWSAADAVAQARAAAAAAATAASGGPHPPGVSLCSLRVTGPGMRTTIAAASARTSDDLPRASASTDMDTEERVGGGGVSDDDDGGGHGGGGGGGGDDGTLAVLPTDAAIVARLRVDPYAYSGRRVDVVIDLGHDVLLTARATKNVPGFRERMYARHHLAIKDDFTVAWHRRGAEERDRRPILRVEESAWGATWYSQMSALEQLQGAIGMRCFDPSSFLRLLLLVIGIRITGGLEAALLELVRVEHVLEPWAPAFNGRIFDADPVLARLPALTWG